MVDHLQISRHMLTGASRRNLPRILGVISSSATNQLERGDLFS